jgi:predicted ATPase
MATAKGLAARKVLGTTGEIAWQVPPLSIPNDCVRGGQPSLENLSAYEAVQVFVARAANCRPGDPRERRGRPDGPDPMPT